MTNNPKMRGHGGPTGIGKRRDPKLVSDYLLPLKFVCHFQWAMYIVNPMFKVYTKNRNMSRALAWDISFPVGEMG